VDAAGAESLRQRLEQQKHWLEAEAVRDGRQPRIDPDLFNLDQLHDGLRIYSARRATGEPWCKRLVDGTWENGTLDEHALHVEERVPVAQIAQVA
jgi:hypothetical protein